MRYLVLSDIHANIDALESVLADAARHGDAPILLLGDLVGYGAEPNAVIDRLRELPIAASIRGNHDRVACGLDEPENFNTVARASALATARTLTARNRQYLRDLPPGPLVVNDLVELCHGTPFDEDMYVFDEMDAVYALRAATRPLCLFGHTHMPFGVRLSGDEIDYLDVSPENPIALAHGIGYLLNVGSVGQPRDGDPRAGYGLVNMDTRTVTCFRVTYPVEAAQARVRAANLPEALAKRLALGR